MSQYDEIESMRDLPLDVSMKSFDHILKIIKSLSNQDALSIFFYAKKEVIVPKNAIQCLGLTRKRFYSRLSELMDIGLIDKAGGTYRHTAFGKIVCDTFLFLEPLVLNKERLQLADSLLKIDSMPEKEKNDLMNQLFSINNSFTSAYLSDLLTPVKMIDSYEDLVEDLTKRIENSKKNIYFATKYTDLNVIQSTIEALKRDVKVYVLAEKMRISEGLHLLKVLLSPKSITSYISFLKDYSHVIKETPIITYSFVTIDEKTTIIEIPHPNKDEFYLAFLFENALLTKKLISIFLLMWNDSEKISFKLLPI